MGCTSSKNLAFTGVDGSVEMMRNNKSKSKSTSRKGEKVMTYRPREAHVIFPESNDVNDITEEETTATL
jgi:hypothetical protein